MSTSFLLNIATAINEVARGLRDIAKAINELAATLRGERPQ